MLYEKLIKLLNDKKFLEIEKIYQINKTTFDKNEDLLTIYGTALANQNKYELALNVFRKVYSISKKMLLAKKHFSVCFASFYYFICCILHKMY